MVTNGHGAGEALTNGSSNGLAESPVTETAPVADNIPSNVDDEPPHQNGTNGTTTPPPTPVATEIEKGQQIEVNNHTRTDNTTQHNSKNITVNTSTTTTKTTEITENTALKTISTDTERTCTSTVTETVVAAAELVQTQTILTKTTNTILPTSHTQASSEVIETVTPSQAEEEVVAAIIKAVSSEPEAETETETEAEGFVLVAPVSTEVEVPVSISPIEPVAEVSQVKIEPLVEIPEVEAKSVADVSEADTESVPKVSELKTEVSEIEFESVIVETRSSSPPPPLPKSPPPSRVSAFVLSEDVIEEQVTPNVPEVNDVKPDEIEQQAISIVAEITEQAAEIVTEQEKQQEEAKVDSVPETIEESSSTVVVEEVLPVQNDEVTAPSPTPDDVQKPIEDQDTPDEKESYPVPDPIDPAAVNDEVAVTEAVDCEVEKETGSISSNVAESSSVSDEQAAIENQVEILEEQPVAVEETTEQETSDQQVISEEAHSDNDKENEIDLVENIISDLDAPITKAGGDLLVELDARSAEQEGESNNKVNSKWQ